MANFWERVEINPFDPYFHWCWWWTGAIRDEKRGYGYVKVRGKNIAAHRRAWELANGPIPEGMMVCHRCDNRLCVNPEHLYLGTASHNARDMTIRNRRKSLQDKMRQRDTFED